MIIHRVAGGAALALVGLLAACGGGGATETDTPLPASVAVVGPSRADTGVALQWQSSVAADAHGLSFEWRFGDGTTSTAAMPTHGYAQPGVYELELSVRDRSGAVVSARRQVRVGAFPMVAGLQCSGPNESGWCWQWPLPNGHAGLDVTFVDAREGWMVGDGGLVLHTADGGQNWTPQTVPTAARLLRVSFGDARHGWIAATNGATWVTQDGGATWRAGGALGLAQIGRVWSRGANLAFATGTPADPTEFGAIHSVYSVDGGFNWRETPWPFVIGEVDADGTLWSADRRETATVQPWQVKPLPTGLQVLSQLAISDSGFAYGVMDADGQRTMQLVMRQGLGQDWTFTPVTLPSSAPIFYVRVTMSSAGLGVLVAYDDATASNPRWARTTDAGRTWDWLASWPAGWTLRGELTVPDGRTVWGAFTDGTHRGLWLSVDAGLTWRRLFPQLSTVDGCCGWDPVSSLQRDRDGALLVHVVDQSLSGWFRSVDDGATWTALPAPGGRPAVTQLWAGSGERLFAAVGNFIHDSTDQGRHWTARQASTPGASYAFNLPDGSGWAVDGYGLLRTADAWQTWTRTTMPYADPYGYPLWGRPLEVLYADGPRIRLRTEGTAFCPRMCDSILVASDDGGLTFSATTYGLPSPGTVSFATADAAVARFQAGWMRTTDAGRTWTPVTPSSMPVGYRIRFLDARRGWILNFGGVIWRTDDGGQTWVAVQLPDGPVGDPAIRPALNDITFNDIAFGDAMHGWIVGDGGVVLATEDGGEHWQVQASGTSLNLTRVIATSKTTAWIGGEQGAILATVSGGRVDP